MAGIINKIKNFRYKGILAIVLVFALMAAILFVELSGVQFNYTEKSLEFLPDNKIVTKEAACSTLEKNTLVLWNSKSEEAEDVFKSFTVIFDDMKVGRDTVDLSCQSMPDLNNYSVAVVLMTDLSPIGQRIIELCDWVYNGGQVMFGLMPEKNAYSSVIESKLGIIDSSYDYSVVESIYIHPDFMVGGSKAYTVTDAYESARTVQLSDKGTTVYLSEGDKDGMALVWKTVYGEGQFVVNNIGVFDKAFRGFYAASYSLLQDVCVYPVINGSSFYLDDFPSQIPEGNSSYISRDYGTTIRDFYINIWWPDMMNFADKYGMKYTGLAIECYDDAVDGTTDANPDTGTFLNFGNMLLRKGGEIGYHGYNHQPLCFDNCEYNGIYDYKTWNSYSAMKTAFDELIDFCDGLFPDVEMAVYVPPSNLLSKEGKEFLLKEYPHIKTVSGIYFEDDILDFGCIQEFCVSKTGVVDQPRIISGCDVNDFMQLGAVSELNLHFVNNHFTHPDDALDPDRGAELGWEELKTRFDKYLSWLYSSAKGIRNFTGSEMSAAVQRFVAVSPKKEVAKDKMTISIDNFYDNAMFFVRFNEKTHTAVKGGKLTHLTGDLYLLEANTDTVTVLFE